MFEEAINTLKEAEVSAKGMLALAKTHTAKQLEDAKQEGAARVTEAAGKAEAEVTDLMRTVERKAGESASDLVSNMENKKAAIGAKAESAMHKAVALIVERIVTDA